MNKRITSLLLCLAMIVCMFASAVPTYAAGTGEFTVTPDRTEVHPGDTITYTVTIGAIEHLQSINFTLVIPDGLIYGVGKEVDGLKELLGSDKAEYTDSTKTFVVSGGGDYSSTGETVLMTFTCKVPEDAALKDYQITLEGDEYFGDPDYYDLPVTVNMASSKITVTAKPVAATGVTLDKETLSLKSGESATLAATVAPSGATNKAVSWKSSNEAVATVDSNGKVTAVAEGNATITVTTADGGFTDTCEVTVACGHSALSKTDAYTGTDCKDRSYNAYWTCDACGQMFSDAAGTNPISGIQYTGDYGPHSYGTTWVDGTDDYHYHVCSVCGGKDEATKAAHTGGTANCQTAAKCDGCGVTYGTTDSGKHIGDALVGITNNDGTHDVKYADCDHIYAENVACSLGSDNKCTVCGYDANHYHGNGVLNAGSEADCKTETNGKKAYYTCSCGDKFYDAACANPVADDADLVITWKHTLTHHAADPADCCNDGTIEYWDCSVCEKKFSDAAGVTAITSIVDEATGNHIGTAWDGQNDTQHWHICTVSGTPFGHADHNGGTATCEKGKICADCEKEYTAKDAANHASTEFTYTTNNDGTHKKANKCCGAEVAAADTCTFGDDNVCDLCEYDKTHICGNGELHQGKDATCVDAGEKDYYTCSCGKKYYDAACTNPVEKDEDLVIAATGNHKDANGDKKCDGCGVSMAPADPDNPQTGDNSNLLLWVTLMTLSAGAVLTVLVMGKKRYQV